MGAVILTIPGPWSKLPAWPSDLPLTHEDPDPHLAGDIKAMARQADLVDALDMGALKRHQGVIRALLDFEDPGSVAHAAAGARLMIQALKDGAHTVLVETASRIIDPRSGDEIDPDDPVSLVHLYVSVFGDGECFYTEGMQAFDLPDVIIAHRNPAEGVLAQGAAFAYAALSVCEGLRLTPGGVFTASESAPRYTAQLEEITAADLEEDPMSNPRGRWRLIRAS